MLQLQFVFVWDIAIFPGTSPQTYKYGIRLCLILVVLVMLLPNFLSREDMDRFVPLFEIICAIEVFGL